MVRRGMDVTSWLDRLRRWKRWIILFTVLVAVRAALPEIVRRVAISQASLALRADVAIGDVDLALLGGGIVLEDVAVRALTPAIPDADAAATAVPTPLTAAEAPPATTPPDPQAAATAPADGPAAPGAVDTGPLIAWKRFAVSVNWLPLFRKTVQLREVVLESPRVALDRLKDGNFNLLALLPAGEATPTPGPTSNTTPAVGETPAGDGTPAAASGTPSAAPPAEGPGWQVGLDSFVLRAGGILFRDFQVQDSEPLEIRLPTIEVKDVALSPGMYGEPSRINLDLAFDDARLQLAARLTLGDTTTAVEANLTAEKLPLRRARLYVPKVGWSKLTGTLDAAITYRFATGTEHTLRGTAALHDLAVQIAGLDQPALAWQSLTVHVDPVDLLAQRAAVSEIELAGATIVVRPQGGVLLPFLAAAAGQAADQVEPTPATPAAKAAPAAPWHWSVSSLHIADSHVRVLGTTPLDVGVQATLKKLADESEAPAHLDLKLVVNQGTLALAGALRLTPPGFGGTLRVADLALPPLVAASAALPAELIQSGRLTTDLTIEAGVAAADAGAALPPHDVRVNGKLALAELRLGDVAKRPFSIAAGSIELNLDQMRAPGILALAGDASIAPGDLTGAAQLALSDVHVSAPDPAGFAFDLRRLDLAIADLTVPAVLTSGGRQMPAGEVRASGRLTLADLRLEGSDAKVFSVATKALDVPIRELRVPAAAGGAVTSTPIRLGIGALQLDTPSVRLTRTAEGLLMPNFSTTSAPPQPPAQPTPPPAPEPASAPAEAAAATPAPPPVVEVVVDALRLAAGSVRVADHTVKPAFKTRLAPIDAELRDLHWPDLAFSDLKLTAVGAEDGKLIVTGSLSPKGGQIEVNGDHIALLPFNPYASTLSGYSLAGGKLSLKTTASFEQGRYKADSSLTLHEFDLQGGEGDSLFQKQFGVPISMALALMRDAAGDIALGIPVEGDPKGTRVGVGTVIRKALQNAIVNALASPLKLVGAVTGSKKIKSLAPAPIGFRLGRAELAADGDEQVDRLGEFLASRPGLGVTLETAVTTGDVRWLREQALRAEWENQGFFAGLRGLADRGTRATVQRALAARAKDDPGALSAEDAAALDKWLAERPPIPAEQLRALAEARLTRVDTALREGNDLDAARIAHGEIPAEPVERDPAVRLKLGTARR